MEHYTRTPNFVFELMGTLSPAEFKVLMVIVRRTYGYGEDWAKISFSLFTQMTGLTRQGAFNCIESLIKDGHIQRRQVGNSFEYSLKSFNSVERFDEENHSTELDIPFNSVEQTESPKTPNVQLSRTESFNSVDPLNKKEKRTTTSSSEDTPAASTKPEPTEQQKMFAKVCDIVGWDYRVLDKPSQGQVAQTLGFLKKGEYTLADLERFWPDVWEHDWRWQKNQQHPTLAQLRQEIGKLRSKVIQPNGSRAAAPRPGPEDGGGVNLATLLAQSGPKPY